MAQPRLCRSSQMVHPNHRPTRSFFGRIKNRDAKASHVLAFKGGSERHKFSWGFRRRACQRRLARLLAAPRLICCLYVRHEPASHHSAAYSLSLFFLLLRFLDYWHHFPLRSPPRNTPAPHLAIRSFASQVAHVFRSRALMLAAAQHPLLFGFGLVPPLHRAVVGWDWSLVIGHHTLLYTTTHHGSRSRLTTRHFTRAFNEGRAPSANVSWARQRVSSCR